MDLNAIKEAIVKNVYYLTSDKKVPLHKHDDKDEIFYCIKGAGFGVLEDSEVELTVGKAFLVPAGTMHSLRTEGDFYVSSFLVPVVDDRLE
jgi:mannose-6-phosphate isomerase-like protein (cupin superfamily)